MLSLVHVNATSGYISTSLPACSWCSFKAHHGNTEACWLRLSGKLRSTRSASIAVRSRSTFSMMRWKSYERGSVSTHESPSTSKICGTRRHFTSTRTEPWTESFIKRFFFESTLFRALLLFLCLLLCWCFCLWVVGDTLSTYYVDWRVGRWTDKAEATDSGASQVIWTSWVCYIVNYLIYLTTIYLQMVHLAHNLDWFCARIEPVTSCLSFTVCLAIWKMWFYFLELFTSLAVTLHLFPLLMT